MNLFFILCWSCSIIVNGRPGGAVPPLASAAAGLFRLKFVPDYLVTVFFKRAIGLGLISSCIKAAKLNKKNTSVSTSSSRRSLTKSWSGSRG